MRVSPQTLLMVSLLPLWFLATIGLSYAPNPRSSERTILQLKTPQLRTQNLKAEKPSCRQAWHGLSSAQRYFPTQKAKNLQPSYEDFYLKQQRQHCEKDWTILIYMAADNDLTPYALLDLYEMEAGYKSGVRRAGSTLKTDVIVHLETRLEAGYRRLHLFQSPTPYLQPTSVETAPLQALGDIESPVVLRQAFENEAQREERSAAEKFAEFLQWGVERYPAKHIMVVVWGHGQGWSAGKLLPEPSLLDSDSNSDIHSGIRSDAQPNTSARLEGRLLKSTDLPDYTHDDQQTSLDQAEEFWQRQRKRGFGGLAFDESSGSFLDLPSIAKTLSTLRSKQLGGKPIDIYAADSCLMQMLEVAYELSGEARFLVGSAAIQNYLGLPYRRILFELNAGRFANLAHKTGIKDEAYLLAHIIPSLQKAGLAANGLQGQLLPEARESMTMSSLSSSELRLVLLPAMQTFGEKLLAFLKDDPVRIIDVSFIAEQAPYYLGGSLSVEMFLSLLRTLILRERERMQTGDAQQVTEDLAAEELWLAIDQVEEAMRRTVINYALGTSYTSPSSAYFLSGFRGMSFWLPRTPEEFRGRVRDFESSRFFQDVQAWQAWLTWLHDDFGM